MCMCHFVWVRCTSAECKNEYPPGVAAPAPAPVPVTVALRSSPFTFVVFTLPPSPRLCLCCCCCCDEWRCIWSSFLFGWNNLQDTNISSDTARQRQRERQRERTRARTKTQSDLNGLCQAERISLLCLRQNWARNCQQALYTVYTQPGRPLTCSSLINMKFAWDADTNADHLCEQLSV